MPARTVCEPRSPEQKLPSQDGKSSIFLELALNSVWKWSGSTHPLGCFPARPATEATRFKRPKLRKFRSLVSCPAGQ